MTDFLDEEGGVNAQTTAVPSETRLGGRNLGSGGQRGQGDHTLPLPSLRSGAERVAAVAHDEASMNVLVVTRLIPGLLRCLLGLHFWQVRFWFYNSSERSLEIGLRCAWCKREEIVSLTVEGVPLPRTPSVTVLRGPTDY